MEKLCEICGKPVTSDSEGSWVYDKTTRERKFFHYECLKGKASTWGSVKLPEYLGHGPIRKLPYQ